jgi:hypothetical protein
LSRGRIPAAVFLPVVVAYFLLLEDLLPRDRVVLEVLTLSVAVFQSLVSLTLFQAAWDAIHGRRVSIRASLAAASRRFVPAVGVSVLSAVLVALGLVVFVVPGLMAMVMLWVAIPVCLVERKGPIASLSRSAELVRGHGWEVFAVVFVLGIIEFIPEKVLEIAYERGEISLEAYLFGPLALNVFMSAVTACATAAGYKALRAEKEPDEIEKIAAAFD